MREKVGTGFSQKALRPQRDKSGMRFLLIACRSGGDSGKILDREIP
jgi:hypothetical protein